MFGEGGQIVIHLLGQGMLYEVHRNKVAMLTAIEKRRAVRLCASIFAVITFAVVYWIVYR